MTTAEKRDLDRLARYTARKIERYEDIFEEIEECLDELLTEAALRIMEKEKRNMAQRIDRCTNYLKRTMRVS